jgi:hypothetical protein
MLRGGAWFSWPVAKKRRGKRKSGSSRRAAAATPAAAAPPDPARIVIPTGPSPEEAQRRVAVLSGRQAEMNALLEPTSRQGPEGDPARLEFARWSLDLGTAFCDAGLAERGIPILQGAATIAEIVVGHRPGDVDALRLGTAAVARLAHELLVQGQAAQAWEWAARTVGAAKDLAELDPDGPEGPLQASRLSAVLASLSPAKKPPPPAYMRDASVPDQPVVAVDGFYGFLYEAVAAAGVAVGRAPENVEARLQLGQEAWNLGMYLEARPGLPGDDHTHYAGLVIESLAPVDEQGLYPDLCTPALRWARALTT